MALSILSGQISFSSSCYHFLISVNPKILFFPVSSSAYSQVNKLNKSVHWECSCFSVPRTSFLPKSRFPSEEAWLHKTSTGSPATRIFSFHRQMWIVERTQNCSFLSGKCLAVTFCKLWPCQQRLWWPVVCKAGLQEFGYSRTEIVQRFTEKHKIAIVLELILLGTLVL